MHKHFQVDPSHFVSLEQAGFDILYAFMLSDGQADEAEYDVIKKYLEEETLHYNALSIQEHSYYSESNLMKETAYLQTLNKDRLIRRFKKAVSSIQEWVHGDEEGIQYQKGLLQFALSLVQAGEKVTSEEQDLIDIIRKDWNLMAN